MNGGTLLFLRQCSPDWPRTRYAVKGGLECLTSCLHLRLVEILLQFTVFFFFPRRVVGVFESLFSIYWDGHMVSVLEPTYERTTFIGFYMLGHFCISKWYLLMYSVLTTFVSAQRQLESSGSREPQLRTFLHWLAFTQTWVTSSWLVFDVGKPSPLRVIIQSWVL